MINIAVLQGTKKSCQEGGCGACVVSLTQFDNVQQKNATFSVNSVCVNVMLEGRAHGCLLISVSAAVV